MMMNNFENIFDKQKGFQKLVLSKANEKLQLPTDSTKWFSYHVQAMVEELGEVMKSDKRWKTHRNERYDKSEKIDEIADVFITAINISLYSGFDGDEIEKAILNKISENIEKIKKVK